MNILFFGDIIGKPGRQGLIKILPDLRSKYDPDLVIANGENLSHGVGVTHAAYKEIIDGGVDFLTNGDHIWAKKDVKNILEEMDSKIVRPANFPPEAPGEGYKVLEAGAYKILIINLLGRVFMKRDYDCPFRKIDEILSDDELDDIKIQIVDFHAEATSEKIAFGHHIDGKISAVIGTHTHIPTADAQILPKGTFYITDVGMVGPKDSIIGKGKEAIIKQYLTQMPVKTDIADDDNIIVSGIFLDIDNKSGKVKKFEQINEEVRL